MKGARAMIQLAARADFRSFPLHTSRRHTHDCAEGKERRASHRHVVRHVVRHIPHAAAKR
jgi:hypothetical protein